MHRQLMKNLLLKSNLLMASLMLSTILSIVVTVFVQVTVVSLPLLKGAASHGENLGDCYPCLLVKHFL